MSLHLTLDIGDYVLVGDDIRIEYHKKIGRKIRLIIKADKSLKIQRIPDTSHDEEKTDNCQTSSPAQ
jgi:sRNA-binding carbon storage regulator CsrA